MALQAAGPGHPPALRSPRPLGALGTLGGARARAELRAPWPISRPSVLGAFALSAAGLRKLACKAARKRAPAARKTRPDPRPAPKAKVAPGLPPKELAGIKQEIENITSKIGDGQGWLTSNADRLKLEFCARDLEPYNRPDLIYDESLLSGEWKVIYCECDSLIGGSFGLLAGEATQTFAFKGRKKVQRELRLKTAFFAGLFSMEWKTVWMPAGAGGDLIVGVEDWYPYIFGQKIALVSFSIEGLIKWTNIYTDETMRVLRTDKKVKRGEKAVEGLVILVKVS